MNSPKIKNHSALVLPGAVARGAFEAGVIQVLAENDVRIDRIVATSSGALNGLAYAAGIRSGREKELADKLVQYWIENGEWNNSLSFNPLTWIKGSGLSSQSGLIKMMREMITPCEASARREVEFRIIVSPLKGVTSRIGQIPATTFEKGLEYGNEDFDSQERLETLFKSVSAACAFPGLFSPVDLDGLGPCIDGGAVNNAPIGYALRELGTNRVIMPIPFPALMTQDPKTSGFGLVNQLIEILINERLFRDLSDAELMNESFDQLGAMVLQGLLTQEQFELVTNTLQLRKVETTEVRPLRHLEQSSFSGFFKKADRVELIAEGRKAALRCLDFKKP
jgi:predicted acylesterase/phospholipase RssA